MFVCKTDHNPCWLHCCHLCLPDARVRKQEHASPQSRRSLRSFGLHARGLAGVRLLSLPDCLLRSAWSNKDKHMLGRLLVEYQGPRSQSAIVLRSRLVECDAAIPGVLEYILRHRWALISERVEQQVQMTFSGQKHLLALFSVMASLLARTAGTENSG